MHSGGLVVVHNEALTDTKKETKQSAAQGPDTCTMYQHVQGAAALAATISKRMIKQCSYDEAPPEHKHFVPTTLEFVLNPDSGRGASSNLCKWIKNVHN